MHYQGLANPLEPAFSYLHTIWPTVLPLLLGPASSSDACHGGPPPWWRSVSSAHLAASFFDQTIYFSDFLIFSSLPMRPGIGRLPKPLDGQPAPSQDTCACMWSYLYSVTFSYTSLLPLCGPCKVPTSSKICVLQSSPLDLEHLAGMDQHLCHYNGLLTHLLPRGWYTDHLGSLPLIQSNCNLRLTTPCAH